MIGVIPAENWDYKIVDAARAIAFLLRDSAEINTINIPDLGNCITTRSGRAAISTAIKSLELPKNARIAVPLYSCPVVFKAIESANCKAVFIDIEKDTYCICPQDLFLKRKEFHAVITIHMFGNVCNMHSVMESAEGKPIIEDCAQSLGSKIGCRMTGSFGKIGVFSFRSGKYLSAGEGGALFSNDQSIRSRILRQIEDMILPKNIEEYVHIFKIHLKSALRSKPFYGLIGYNLWKLYNKKVDYASTTTIELGQIYRSDFKIASRRLKTVKTEILKQRAAAAMYSYVLNKNADMLCHEKKGYFYNRYIYPIQFLSKSKRDWIADYLFKRKISTMKPYENIAAIAALHHGYNGGCSTTENIANKILAVPIHYGLKKSDNKRIVNTLSEGLREIGL